MADVPERWCHVYGQFAWHSPACIRGTKEALSALRDALDQALKEGKAEVGMCATDGEGYAIDVHCVSTIAAVGTPEYIMESAVNITKAERERVREVNRSVDYWDEAEPA